MKAGSAGSNPDGVNFVNKPISQPLRVLLRDIGGAVFALNTAVVGLDAVENDYQKPNTLNISWEPRDREIAARKTRKFLLESIVVRVSEVINQFVLTLSKLHMFAEVREKWNHDTSISDKVNTIATRVLDKDDYLISGVILLVHWRNHIVHPNSNAALKANEKQVLIVNKNTISERYKGLNTSDLLDHFEAKRPTLKDISSLIAMTINLARKIDRTMQNNLSKAEFDDWLDYYQLIPMMAKIKRETSPKKYNASVCQLLKSRAPYLLDAYLEYYDSSPSH